MKNKLEKKWLVVILKPNAYDLATRNLEQQGFEIFLPKMTVTSRKNNKFLSKKIYLFPGYMFVSFDPEILKWGVINNTYGVSKILSFNGKPALISSDIILALKYRYSSDVSSLENDNLKKGDRIKMIAGPFANFLAKVESSEGSSRMWVLLENARVFQKIKLKNQMINDYIKV